MKKLQRKQVMPEGNAVTGEVIKMRVLVSHGQSYRPITTNNSMGIVDTI